jgi:transposase
MKAISNDLRLRIIEVLQENQETQPEIAERFSVSLSFVEKLWHRFRSTGSYEAKPHGGGRKRVLAEHEELIREKVKKQPDITLAELSEEILAKTEVSSISLVTISEELSRLGLPRKKR